MKHPCDLKIFLFCISVASALDLASTYLVTSVSTVTTACVVKTVTTTLNRATITATVTQTNVHTVTRDSFLAKSSPESSSDDTSLAKVVRVRSLSPKVYPKRSDWASVTMNSTIPQSTTLTVVLTTTLTGSCRTTVMTATITAPDTLTKVFYLTEDATTTVDYEIPKPATTAIENPTMPQNSPSTGDTDQPSGKGALPPAPSQTVTPKSQDDSPKSIFTQTSPHPGGPPSSASDATFSEPPTFGPRPTVSNAPGFSFGGVTYTATASSAFVVDGKIIGPGEPGITVSGTIYSLAPDASQAVVSVVGSPNAASTIDVMNSPANLPYSTLTNNIIPSPVTIRLDQPIIIEGKTLAGGLPTVISGTFYSLAQGSSALVVGSSTVNIPHLSAYTTITNAPLPSPLTVTPGQPIVIAGQTLIPGASTIISGTAYSLATDGSNIVIGSSTVSISPTSTYPVDLTALLSSLSLIPSGQPVLIAGTTLTPGVVATISGTRYSLAPGGTALVVGSTTINLPVTGAALPFPSALSLAPGQPIVVAGATLTPGVAMTISGTRYSLAPGSTALVVGSSTIPIKSIVSTTSGNGLGPYILNGLGVGGISGTGTSPTTAYTTNASYTGPVFQGNGIGKASSWGWVWMSGGVAALSASLMIL